MAAVTGWGAATPTPAPRGPTRRPPPSPKAAARSPTARARAGSCRWKELRLWVLVWLTAPTAAQGTETPCRHPGGFSPPAALEPGSGDQCWERGPHPLTPAPSCGPRQQEARTSRGRLRADGPGRAPRPPPPAHRRRNLPLQWKGMGGFRWDVGKGNSESFICEGL